MSEGDEEGSAQRRCDACGHHNSSDAAKCDVCGAPFDEIHQERPKQPMAECERCHADVPLIASVCWKCGMRFGSVPAVPVETPPAIQEQFPSPPKMAPCPTCERMISVRAVSCPGCGELLSTPQTTPVGGRGWSDPVVTVQQTSKQIKFWILVNWLAFLAGVSACSSGDKELGGNVCVTTFLIGIVLQIYRWWHHG